MVNINKIMDEITPHLKEYLNEKGINTNSFFSCIHPDHPDIHPSCHVIDEGPGKDRVFYCFSCMHAGNIFTAAHFLEKKPITGPEFFQDTMKYLADKYGVVYEPIEISPDIKAAYQRKRAYNDAANITHSMSFSKGELKRDNIAIKHLLDRGITEESIRKFKIGCIDNFKSYSDQMKRIGWSDKKYLTNIDLCNKGIFNSSRIIIPIMDDKGKTIAFVARRAETSPNDKGESKYINSLNSDIYRKGEVLFNFNTYEKEEGPLYIVEGYLDAVYLTQIGLKNVAAIGATVLTEQHVELLMRYGAKDVILCLDQDKGGIKGTKLAIERMAPYKYFKLRVMDLPKDYDPDSYVREFGLDKFRELGSPDVALSAFFWLLKQHTFEDDPMAMAEQAIPAIAAEESSITRLKMIKELSRLTAIPELDIRKDVDSLVTAESSKFIEGLSNISNFVQVQLNRKSSKDTKSILQDAIIKVKNLEMKFNNTRDCRSEYSDKISNLRDKVGSGDFSYGLIVPKFKKFEKTFDGIPYTSCLTLIGGRPSAGKTAFLTILGINIVHHNEDAAVFYMSIDDTTELMTLKMLASYTGLSVPKIKSYSKQDKETKKLINEGWEWIEKLKERFIIADATMGKSVDTLEGHVDWFIREFPNKKRVLMLDNFHKMSEDSNYYRKTDAISSRSERIKDIVQNRDIHLIETIELRKLEGTEARPTVSDLKDSVQSEYDADVIILVHNDYQVKKERTNLYYVGNYGDTQKPMPYLEVRIWKNKVNGQCNDLAYRLNTYNLRIFEDKWSTIVAKTSEKKTTSGTKRRVF